MCLRPIAGQEQAELTRSRDDPLSRSSVSISWCSLLAGCRQIRSTKRYEMLPSSDSFSRRWGFEKAWIMLLFAQRAVYCVNPAVKQSGSLVLLLCSAVWWSTFGFRLEWLRPFTKFILKILNCFIKGLFCQEQWHIPNTQHYRNCHNYKVRSIL